MTPQKETRSYGTVFALLLRKNEKKKTPKKYLIVCALPETEDHINSFQVDVSSLMSSENL